MSREPQNNTHDGFSLPQEQTPLGRVSSAGHNQNRCCDAPYIPAVARLSDGTGSPSARDDNERQHGHDRHANQGTAADPVHSLASARSEGQGIAQSAGEGAGALMTAALRKNATTLRVAAASVTAEHSVSDSSSVIFVGVALRRGVGVWANQSGERAAGQNQLGKKISLSLCSVNAWSPARAASSRRDGFPSAPSAPSGRRISSSRVNANRTAAPCSRSTRPGLSNHRSAA